MKRNKFSLSHYNLFTADMGQLIPVALTEVLPGDTMQMATSALIRVSPLLAPVMHPVQVRIHHWFVPNRLVWDKWEDFITGGPNNDDASVVPYMSISTIPTGHLLDYYGLPSSTNTHHYNAMPFRGYDLIWNENYRDQDLQTELTISKASGVDTTTDIVLQNVGWEKDYFTTARPWTQKGPEVTIPLTGSAPVLGIGVKDGTYGLTSQNVIESDGTTSVYAAAKLIDPSGAATQALIEKQAGGDFPNIHADLTGVSAIDINTLRMAFALQRYAEARAQYGSRYTEYLRYLGVRSSDARLQRPEYLGGGKQTIQWSEVLQTSPTTDGDDQVGVGNLKGHGIGAIRSNRFRRFFEEHGFVHTFFSVRPKTMYTQGVPKMWSRTVKEDYHQRELEHVGQMEVHNREIYANAASPSGVFGYQDRYDEYRRSESRVSGEFRNTLDFWHMARQFASEPVLNADFIKSNPTKRINAVQSANVLWVMANHSIQVRRMLSPKGTSYIY